MKLKASLASAEVSAGAVAKADQKLSDHDQALLVKYMLHLLCVDHILACALPNPTSTTTTTQIQEAARTLPWIQGLCTGNTGGLLA